MFSPILANSQPFWGRLKQLPYRNLTIWVRNAGDFFQQLHIRYHCAVNFPIPNQISRVCLWLGLASLLRSYTHLKCNNFFYDNNLRKLLATSMTKSVVVWKNCGVYYGPFCWYILQVLKIVVMCNTASFRSFDCIITTGKFCKPGGTQTL